MGSSWNSREKSELFLSALEETANFRLGRRKQKFTNQLEHLGV
jgi:hypothetical protein